MTVTPVLSTSAVAPVVSLVRGAQAHRAAVERLLSSYRAIPAGQRVRLAKRTSNLFRNRAPVTSPGLDVSGLDGVISIDPAARTADVQAMCTYETLVATTLPYGLIPLVVPQLKTITLGGAVTGLGIESSSFRNGLPHESVLEMDILTGDGELVTVRPPDELFRGFPNSYGTLGYATRLRIELEPVRPAVDLRHVRFDDLHKLTQAIETISTGGGDVDFLDGVVFSATESYLTLGTYTDDLSGLSDYTGAEPYYRSIQRRQQDKLTVHDYLWRWDTDWFWCSAAFGAQNPKVRKYWPARYRRSDVFHKLVGLETKYGFVSRIDAWRGKPARERVIQDVELPVGRTAEFLEWYLEHVPMTPVWLCPLRLRDSGNSLPADSKPWSLYPLRSGHTYVNAGFWGTVAIEPGRRDGDKNREIEDAVAGFGGHKSLYSDAYYDEATFWAAYGGNDYPALKAKYDGEGRLLDLYAKTVGRH
ncbi:FAD-binding oxidoreductase [Kineosporia babensis]|uniref:Delta(24)-sterol reductase n=1 Tax=Kineosporia babensis TaxID=499548 RepID=A0A9X1NIX4_9ACTN|nr:FAD-binding oxidoreductase [Kineosporia babensis]MCD5314654.1 FAD-binding oxidoreductase [Kineosporia babensis]